LTHSSHFGSFLLQTILSSGFCHPIKIEFFFQANLNHNVICSFAVIKLFGTDSRQSADCQKLENPL